MELKDFLQEAHLVLLEAARNYDRTRGVKLETYSIGELIYHFKKMERQRRRSPLTVAVDEVPEAGVTLDNFWMRVTDVMTSRGNKRAKILVRALLTKYCELRRCSLAELQRCTGMSNKEFHAALFQLARF